MEHFINMTEIKQTQAEAKLCSQMMVDSQSPTPVSQSGHEYALARPPTSKPEERHALPKVRKLANPAPLGLCAFALTSFMSNIMNVHLGLTIAAENVGSALVYGGTVQLLAGMWEMALGNTFSATSFCSYGAYWITFGVISSLEGTKIVAAPDTVCQKEMLMGLFLLAWFIFTTMMLLCTLKSSLAIFLLFFFLDMYYLLLGIANMQCDQGHVPASIQRVGGYFGLLAAFTAWYNAFAGLFDTSNGFFNVPLGHFPWSPVVRSHQGQFNRKLGVWGLPINLFALAYTAWVTVWLAFPTYLPVTGENMNYAAPIFVASIFVASTLFALVYWFIKGRTRSEGLNKEFMRLAVDNGELQLK
ncbi:uncharacterized protein N7482_009856 [Penicillium canariense]|uniref:Uncharacterized protein n=1 Tax=Penicillium canariense TaxID=189055 RepID=A0A9W9HNA1_9EURO|nr:uncharacterized protein N7482_009856 [Penicillium canariense]KAJ5153378.1 hypothetical protein N7482_009856 [Penicillium canariense]